MSIDAIKREAPLAVPERPIGSSVVSASLAPAAGARVDPQTVAAAAQELQTHFKSVNPEFSIDYLSGLGVVRMRAASTGEVIFQIPDIDAVQLARLIRDGVSPAALPLMKTTA